MTSCVELGNPSARRTTVHARTSSSERFTMVPGRDTLSYFLEPEKTRRLAVHRLVSRGAVAHFADEGMGSGIIGQALSGNEGMGSGAVWGPGGPG